MLSATRTPGNRSDRSPKNTRSSPSTSWAIGTSSYRPYDGSRRARSTSATFIKWPDRFISMAISVSISRISSPVKAASSSS